MAIRGPSTVALAKIDNCKSRLEIRNPKSRFKLNQETRKTGISETLFLSQTLASAPASTGWNRQLRLQSRARENFRCRKPGLANPRFTIPEEHAFAWVASFGTKEQKELALWQNQTDLQHWQSGDAL